MVIVKANLLGIPEVLMKEEKIYFPYRKAEALFYYVLTKKQASRDDVINLIWGDISEDLARKNLRNAVYSIKKLFNKEIIVSPKRSLLMLNPDIQFECDIHKYLNNKDTITNFSEELIKVYRGDFLEGFYVKNAEVFEEWIIQKREQFRLEYINEITKCIQKLMKKKDIDSAKSCCKKLFSIDDLNEQAYKLLMGIYMEEGEYGKAAYTYNVLKDKLENELGVSPNEETEKLYKKIIDRKIYNENNNNCGKLETFYGRVEEMEILLSNHKSFVEDDRAKSIFIKGEAGIGKTRLVCEFLNKIKGKDLYVIRANCYQAEEKYILKPWNTIFEKISKILKGEDIKLSKSEYRFIASIFPNFDIENGYEYIESLEKWDMLKYQALESITIDIINRVCRKKRIILFLDDIQWIDQMSLSLIKNIILKLNNRRFMAIFTCREGSDIKIDDFITFMRLNDLISEFEINPLTKEETMGFVKKSLPDYSFSNEELNNIYLNTEGNTFFLVQCLNNFKNNKNDFRISTKMQDILKTRLHDITPTARKLLSIISIFFDMVKIEELQELVRGNYLELMYSIDELQKKALIKEMYQNGQIKIAINHIKMREYVYSQLSNLEKVFLHKREAEIIENNLKNSAQDFPLYSRLIYHFTGCGDKLKELEYRIKYLNVYLSTKHEIFPVLYNDYSSEDYLLTEEQIKDRFKEISAIIEELKREDVDREKLSRIQMEFDFIVGRDFIRKGEYKKGLDIIDSLTNDSINYNNSKLTLQCYKQIIYYSMNINNFSLMKAYIDKAIKISEENHYNYEIPVILRLKGYERIMIGRFDEGEKILNKSIDLFNELENREKYILNIAAAYNFIGESKMMKKEYEEALNYFELAINTCTERDINLGLPIFYTNAGQALYEVGIYDKAYDYIKKALGLYNKLNFVWKRDKTDELYGILCRVLYTKLS